MPTTNTGRINIRINPEIKAKAMAEFKKLGITMSEAIEEYLKNVSDPELVTLSKPMSGLYEEFLKNVIKNWSDSKLVKLNINDVPYDVPFIDENGLPNIKRNFKNKKPTKYPNGSKYKTVKEMIKDSEKW